MNRKRRWGTAELQKAVATSKSVREVIKKLGLIPAGGNYVQIKRFIKLLKCDTSHFLGKGWSKNLQLVRQPILSLNKVLKNNSEYQSYKLKRRLFAEKLKTPQCEECGWAKYSKDGRLPLELDHINGKRTDNRLHNLRILCPNCHSLKPTHRGKNKLGWRNR